MQTKSRRCFGILALGILSVVDFPARGADGPYRFLKEIPVGGEGGWDYSSVDESGRYFGVLALGICQRRNESGGIVAV